MQTGEPEEHYLTAITWNNDNEKIYIGILNRGQDTLNFNEYNTLNGEFCQTIFHDEDEQYVEPQGPAHFLPGSTTEFVWLAQRDGYYHLWLHNTKTLKAKQIEKGNYVVTSFDGFDGKGNAYYTSTEVSPLQRHFYKVNIKNGKKVRITQKHGTHSVVPSKSGDYFIDNYSSTDVPRAVCIQDEKGRFFAPLYEAENPLKDYNLGVTEIDSIKDDPLLFPLVTLIIMDVFIQKMRIKKNRKVLVIEEAWKAIASPMMAEYIKYLYKTARKFWASVGVVTQEIQDIVGSPIVKEAIINNSDVVMLLDQSKFRERFDEIKAILGLTDVDCKKIFTINRLENKEGRSFFREVFIRRGSVGAVYGVEEPHECYMTYTTERAEKEALKLYKRELKCSHQQAIEAYCRDWNRSGISKSLPFAQKVNQAGHVLNLPAKK